MAEEHPGARAEPDRVDPLGMWEEDRDDAEAPAADGPLGLTVRITGADRDEAFAQVGPMTRHGRTIRKISTSRRDLIFGMRPTAYDPEGRARLIVPLRAFADAAQAAAFEAAARRGRSEESASTEWLREDEPL